ncbi:SCO family protein [Bacillus sp. NP157]|nr:SCO family protein [Bacillus sp. NP157]
MIPHSRATRARASIRSFAVTRFVLLILLCASTCLVSACQKELAPQWKMADVSGHLPDLAFSLTDDNSKAVTAADYQGHITLLYFGYTHCPDVCPLTLTHLHVILDRMGAAADSIRILFVSVDPARDTPQVMHEYVHAFDKRAVGLSGPDSELEALVKRYRASYTRDPPKADGSYEVDHSPTVYVFDAKGRARLIATPKSTPDDVVHDLTLMTTLENAR